MNFLEQYIEHSK